MAAAPAPRSAWLAVAAATFVCTWGGNQFTPLLVFYRAEHGLSEVTVDAVLVIYICGLCPALLISGRISDRFGRRPVLGSAVALSIVGSLILAIGETPALMAGRVLSGMAVGAAMVAGTAWIKELSAPSLIAGARRSALAITGGLGLGAGSAGLLAQWAPFPSVAPYAAHLAVAVPIAFAVWRAPETHAPHTPAPHTHAPQSRTTKTATPRTRRPEAGPGSVAAPRPGLLLPRRLWGPYVLHLLPLAPWVFGSAAVAYAVLPVQVADSVRSAPIAFSALLCLITLGSGFLAQTFSTRVEGPRGAVIALGVVVAGMLVATAAAAAQSPWLAVPAASILGVGYGLSMFVGLLTVQRLAHPDDLAVATGWYYCLTYVGFAAPLVMTTIHESFNGPSIGAMLGMGAVIAAGCTALAAVQAGRHRERRRTEALR